MANNSIIVRREKMDDVFAAMESKKSDFGGGMRLFPYLKDGEFCNLNYIPERVQSYFIVFRKEILGDDLFYVFGENVKEEKTLK